MYPDPPGPRIAYDLDGTVGFVIPNRSDATNPVQLVQAAMTAMNADKTRGMFADAANYWILSASNPPRLVLIFPTLMRLRGIFLGNRVLRTGTSGGIPYSTSASYDARLEVSTDTTNGVDGTWQTLLYPVVSPPRAMASDINAPGYLASIAPDGTTRASVAQSDFHGVEVGSHFRNNQEVGGVGWQELEGSLSRNVKAIRILFQTINSDGWTSSSGSGSNDQGTLVNLHLYGEPDTDANEHRLEIVDPDDEETPISLGWGDVSQSEVLVQQFKIRNVSTVKAAEVIDVSAVASSPSTTPAPHLGIEFSTNGTTFSSTLSLSSLDPEEVSGTLYVRLTVASSGIIGPWGPRMRLEVGEWV